MTEIVAMIVSVTGRVQGVGYRAWLAREAQRHGLVGWVRNEPDGSVSALIEGEDAVVDVMLEAMKSGPIAARVDHLSALPGALTETGVFVIAGQES